MYRKCLIAALSVLLAAPSTAMAVPKAGDNEVQISGGFFRATGSGTGNFNADLAYGKYLTPGWQVGIRQDFSYTLVDEGSDPWLATTSPFLEYHFMNDGQRSPTILPFLGGFVGAAWNEDDITGTVGPSTGLKYFFHEQTFLSVRYRYEWFFDEFDEVNETIDSNHVVTFGLGFTWG